LDVYRLAIGYVAWVDEKADGLTGSHRSATDQWLCASQSVSLNIADGNGKTADADRRRNFENRIDPDSDSDLEGAKPQQGGEADEIATSSSRGFCVSIFDKP